MKETLTIAMIEILTLMTKLLAITAMTTNILSREW